LLGKQATLLRHLYAKDRRLKPWTSPTAVANLGPVVDLVEAAQAAKGRGWDAQATPVEGKIVYQYRMIDHWSHQ